MRLGCHLSIARGLPASARMAGEVGANTFQFFTRNPRGRGARVIPADEISRWKETRDKEDLFPVVGHLPYVVNLASPRDDLHTFAREVVAEDLGRMGDIGAEYLVVHPGSHVKEGPERGINRILQALESIFENYRGPAVLLLETMSGQGSEIGSLPEIKKILGGMGNHPGLGVCLDSCHLTGAGYDFTREEGVARLLEDLESQVGLERVKVFHLNDSKFPPGSKKDRHAFIGQGYLQKEGIMNILTEAAWTGLPFILESPVKDYKQYGEEIQLIQGWLGEG